MRGLVACALAFSAVAAPHPAPSTAPSTQHAAPSTQRVLGTSPSGHLANIDVIVSDARGRGIADLKAADFELREEGTAQTLEQVRFVRVSDAADSAPRVFAVFLDEYHVRPGENADRARAAVEQF